MKLSRNSILLLAILCPALIGLGGCYYAVRCFQSYGWTLFLGLPVLVSFLSAFIYRRFLQAAWIHSYGVSLLSVLLVGIFILLFALDGLICLLMAFPLIAALALAGSTLGHFLGRKMGDKTAGVLPLLSIALFPFLVSWENTHEEAPPMHIVVSKVSIQAPIDSVWQEVIAFDRITDPPDGIFLLGIAYPVQAHIYGYGPGAIRHYIFSTGPFVELITKWDTPHSLESSVSANPAPLKELSFWPDLDTPHLHRTFASSKGQFHLWEENGKTILEGSTWYADHIMPDWYWHWTSDYKIHLRVLNHIKQSVEKNNFIQ
jgi:hypothetical protein